MAGRKLDDIWMNFERLTKSGKTSCRAKCLNCGKVMQGLVARMKLHYHSCVPKTTCSMSDESSAVILPSESNEHGCTSASSSVSSSQASQSQMSLPTPPSTTKEPSNAHGFLAGQRMELPPYPNARNQPLLRPFYAGWKREILVGDGWRDVRYITPNGETLTSKAQIQVALATGDHKLTLMDFSFLALPLFRAPFEVEVQAHPAATKAPALRAGKRLRSPAPASPPTLSSSPPLPTLPSPPRPPPPPSGFQCDFCLEPKAAPAQPPAPCTPYCFPDGRLPPLVCVACRLLYHEHCSDGWRAKAPTRMWVRRGLCPVCVVGEAPVDLRRPEPDVQERLLVPTLINPLPARVRRVVPSADLWLTGWVRLEPPYVENDLRPGAVKTFTVLLINDHILEHVLARPRIVVVLGSDVYHLRGSAIERCNAFHVRVRLPGRCAFSGALKHFTIFVPRRDSRRPATASLEGRPADGPRTLEIPTAEEVEGGDEPVAALRLVFRHLDTVSLLRCRLVCQNWRKAVDNSPALCGGRFHARPGHVLSLRDGTVLWQWLSRRRVTQADLRQLRDMSDRQLARMVLAMLADSDAGLPLQELRLRACPSWLAAHMVEAQPDMRVLIDDDGDGEEP